MTIIKYAIIIIFITLSKFSAASVRESNVLKLLEQTVSEKIFLEPMWLRLMHYEISDTNGSNESWLSRANSSFFISEFGANDPKKELLANLKLLLGENTRQSYACRFPARAFWLKQHLSLDIPSEHCIELETWIGQFSTQTIDLIFASSYLENPSSLFGHTYLKVKSSKYNNELLGYSLNIVADTKTDQPGVSYIYNGVSGSYSSKLEVAPFYKSVKAYSEYEGRDLWTYSLALSEAQIKLILLHLWEIRIEIFDYYFLKKNCSYLILTALNLAQPEIDFVEDYSHSTIPLDTIRWLNSNQFVSGSEYTPAKLKSVQRAYELLSPAELTLSNNLVFGTEQAYFSDFHQRPFDRQAIILDVALLHLDYLIAMDKIDRDYSNFQFAELTKQRMQLNESSSFNIRNISAPDPLNSHRASALTISSGYQNSNPFIGMQYRAAYHEFLDPILGFDEGNSVKLFSTKLRYTEDDSVELREIGIVEIEKRTIFSDIIKTLSWKFKLARTRKTIHSKDQLINSINFKVGNSFKIDQHLASYFLGLGVDQSNLFDNNYGVEPSINLELTKQTNNYAYSLTYEVGKYVEGLSSKRSKVDFSLSYSNSIDYRILLSLGKEFSSNKDDPYFEIGYRAYF